LVDKEKARTMSLKDKANLRAGQVRPQSASQKNQDSAFPNFAVQLQSAMRGRIRGQLLAFAALGLVVAGAQGQSPHDDEKRKRESFHIHGAA